MEEGSRGLENSEAKGTDTVEQKISQALRNKEDLLDLSHSELTELPESLGDLGQLRSLNLSNNRLTKLPDWLGDLKQLQVLELSNNELATLPERLGELRQLQALYLYRNKLTNLPEWLGGLRELQLLYFFGNELTELPEWLGDLTGLQSLDLGVNKLRELPEWLRNLRQLRTLHLFVNELTMLPDWLCDLKELRSLDLSSNKLTTMPGSLSHLRQLRSLDLSRNKLTTLPESLDDLRKLQVLNLRSNGLRGLSESLGDLKELRSLDLSFNELRALPESLRDLGQLRSLNLSDNKLPELPEWLGELRKLELLDLANNELRELPESLAHLNQLKRLCLHENEALGIPPEVLGANKFELREEKESFKPQEVLAWYFQARAGATQRLNEAKMLLVGQGGVGKTSLAHYLINNKPCNAGELPTEGININDWSVQGKKGATGKFEKINVHVWDFGGQEIMHGTHQFFLTRRSLYLLVIDARAGEKESNLHYWLKIIQSYGAESPVIVVVNKCDQHPHELNETRLMRDYPNIRGFIQTSCSSGQGIAQLRRDIGKHLRRLPHVFDMLPHSYFEVKGELEEAAAQKSYIPIEEYREICERYSIEQHENQDHLIRFLHDLGVVLNFQDPDDPYCQNDPFVLNPEWVTVGVYAIVNYKDLKGKRDGLLTCKMLSAILNSLAGYPRDRHAFIVRKMMQFELAYEIKNGNQACWLIPELLDPKEPKDLQWNPEESFNFQYAYPVLPAGIICRFIVRMHHYVDPKNSWRSGTVLTIDDHKVLVRGDTEKNKAFIAVQGPVKQRKEILAIVRDAFRYVHSTIPALSPKEEEPLPDKPNIAVEYEYLLELEDLGEQSFVPPGAGKRYSVTELLNGVDSTSYRNERLRRKQKEEKIMGHKHVFVSYLHINKDEVERLVSDLENAGESVWWDENILGGGDWKEEIRQAMKDAYAVVLCLSTELAERYRSGVYPEIRDAIDTYRQYGPGKSFIFPVRLDDCEVPAIEIDSTRTLDRIQHIDLFPESKRRAGLQKLLKSLATAPEHP